MKNLIAFLFFLTCVTPDTLLATNSDQGDLGQPRARFQPPATCEALELVGQKYLAFMLRAGQTDTPATADEVSTLFAAQCIKTVNGRDIFTRSCDLPAQLADARSVVGQWTGRNFNIAANPHKRTCLVEFIWKGTKSEEHIVMANLSLDDTLRINAIREVYNLCHVTLEREAAVSDKAS